jgi:5-methyltetrahydrofolate--homocysteine methyltransferase
MVDTILSSNSKEVVIGDGRPFVIIGERINPSGRKLLAAEMAEGNYDRVRSDAIAQVAAGAHVLDVNAGLPLADEPAILAEAIQLVQQLTDVPIAIDSSVVEALERGLAVVKGKPLLNSITGEDERLDLLLPLVKKYGCAFIGMSNDETGISQDPDKRFAVARKIVERAQDYGIPREDVLIDPLVLPISAMGSAGRAAFKILRRCQEELGVNTCCGASNVSFGLPNRPALNGAFLAMAIANGLTSAITNPIEAEIKRSILAADVMMGHDVSCQVWIQTGRQAGASGEEPAARPARRPRPTR